MHQPPPPQLPVQDAACGRKGLQSGAVLWDSRVLVGEEEFVVQ